MTSDAAHMVQSYQTYNSGTPEFLGFSDDKGRLNVVVDYNNDIRQYWQGLDVRRCSLQASAAAVELGVNVVIYAMTHRNPIGTGTTSTTTQLNRRGSGSLAGISPDTKPGGCCSLLNVEDTGQSTKTAKMSIDTAERQAVDDASLNSKPDNFTRALVHYDQYPIRSQDDRFASK